MGLFFNHPILIFSMYVSQITDHDSLMRKISENFRLLSLKVLELLKFTPETWSMDEFSKEYMLKTC